jgi:hypothetical protein
MTVEPQIFPDDHSFRALRPYPAAAKPNLIV